MLPEFLPEDTIAAISTPPGRGGIGIVRLSGERALAIAGELIRWGNKELEPQRTVVGEFIDPEAHASDGRASEGGAVLDQVVCTFFRKPHSYTAEDIVEMACHGSPVVLARLLECCLRRGARAAEPGEFTMRAFLNGRIDLAQAEAVRDLIDARTLFQARVAARQMEGAVSERIKPYKQKLTELIAALEAGIDFADDDVPVMEWDEVGGRIEACARDLEELSQGFTVGRMIHEGLSLAIVGRPNVGKSSLFNRLLDQDRAIVTATPGTTRDLVAESANIGGIPLRLVDTAGIRSSTEEIESIGIRKSFQAIADSDLALVVLDGSETLTEEDRELIQKVAPLGRMLVAVNKIDLPARMEDADVRALTTRNGSSGPTEAAAIIHTSALTGENIPELRRRILATALPVRELESGSGYITNLRHQQLIRRAVEALRKAQKGTEQEFPHEMILLDLYNGLHSLDEITGQTATEDILGLIFSRFCIGK